MHYAYFTDEETGALKLGGALEVLWANPLTLQMEKLGLRELK